MAQKALGKHFRSGLSLLEITQMLPDDATAERWFVEKRWPDGPACPCCGSINVQSNAKHKTMPFRCRDKTCAKRFSVKTGTIMEGSKLGYQVWVIAMYLVSTSLKGAPLMKLHRDMDITQKSAWHLTHRLRKTMARGVDLFKGPVEVDETSMGGKERNKNAKKNKHAGRCTVGKTVVAGSRDRNTSRVTAVVVSDKNPDLAGLRGRQHGPVSRGVPRATAYRDLSFNHATVKHSINQYVTTTFIRTASSRFGPC